MAGVPPGAPAFGIFESRTNTLSRKELRCLSAIGTFCVGFYMAQDFNPAFYLEARKLRQAGRGSIAVYMVDDDYEIQQVNSTVTVRIDEMIGIIIG